MALKHPRDLYTLFFTEMWERFSFYLMIGILYPYLVDHEKGGLGWTGKEASSLVGTYIALVYFTPFLGGLIADRLLGCRKTIILGGISMMIGHIVLAFHPLAALYTGMGFLVIGNGLFKPNISTLVGNLYPPGSPLKDSGYSIFYMGINIGAFTCNFVAAWVRNTFDDHAEWGLGGWHAAFGTAGVGMLLGLLIFLSRYRSLAAADRQPLRAGQEGRSAEESLMPLWLGALAPALALGALGYWLAWAHEWELGPGTTAFLFACLPVAGFYLWIWRRQRDPVDRGRVAALLAIFAVTIVFWSIFHQNTTALTDWAMQSTDRRPNAVVEKVIEAFPAFAEEAPPSYFENADPSTPRPAPSSLTVVTEERLKELKERREAGTLTPEEARQQRTNVTQEQHERIYAGRTSSTPILEPGQALKVVNTELFQSINAFFVVAFTPLVMMPLWAFLRRRGKEPSTAAKIGTGLLLTSLSPLVMLGAVVASNDGNPRASAWWLFGSYAVVTLGELCLSPMGLSLVSKAAPAQIRAFMMGGWFVATSIGNKFSGVFGERYHEWDHRFFFLVTSSCVLAAGLAIFMILPWLKRNLPAEGEGH